MKLIILALAALIVTGCARKPFPPPQYVGEALPTSTIPLKEAGPYLGDIPKADHATIDLYVRSFDELNFKSEWNGADPWIRKKNRPVRVRAGFYEFKKSRPDSDKALVKSMEAEAKEVLGRISRITGLPIAPDDQRYGVNGAYVGIVENQSEEICAARWSDSVPDGTMDDGVVVISHPFTAVSIRSCLTEELSQLHGPINDATVVEQSMWRPYSSIGMLNKRTYDDLTWHDAVILRVLYHEELKPGMHRDQAMPIVRRLMARVLAELNR